MGFLYANATEMVTDEQAQCLHALEQVNSMSTATRACVLGSFISGRATPPTRTTARGPG
jgi:hypothetical protein